MVGCRNRIWKLATKSVGQEADFFWFQRMKLRMTNTSTTDRLFPEDFILVPEQISQLNFRSVSILFQVRGMSPLKPYSMILKAIYGPRTDKDITGLVA